MRPRDLVMIFVSLLSMIAGVSLPVLDEPLRGTPRICLMILWYLGFLSVGVEALHSRFRCMPKTLCALAAVRLLALPVVSFMIFQLLMPRFALGALLVGGASIGVVAPVFSIMVKADTALVLAGNLITSLLLPLTLPLLLYVLGAVAAVCGLTGWTVSPHFSLSGMTVSLCITILVPFALALLTRKSAVVTEAILRRQFPVAVLTCGLSTLAIFSQYSHVLRQTPQLVVQAVGAAFLLGLVMMLCGGLLPRTMQPQTRLGFLISYGTMNNVLMLIVSTEFFSVNESLIAAMYLVPLNLLLLFYRRCSRAWAVDMAA